MKLADRIKQHIEENAENEDNLTVSAIAQALDEDAVLIGFVLDSYQVREDGTTAYVGTGAGGNWVKVEEPTEEEVLERQLKDNVITQEDYDLRMELVKRGQNPRDAQAMQALVAERRTKEAKS